MDQKIVIFKTHQLASKEIFLSWLDKVWNEEAKAVTAQTEKEIVFYHLMQVFN